MLSEEAARKDRANRFGALLKKLRDERGWSLRQVEEQLGGEISNPYLSQLERGERNVPRLELVQKLAKVFDVPMERFLKEATFLIGQSRKVTEKDELWDSYQELSPKHRAIVKDMIDLIQRHESGEISHK